MDEPIGYRFQQAHCRSQVSPISSSLDFGRFFGRRALKKILLLAGSCANLYFAETKQEKRSWSIIESSTMTLTGTLRVAAL